MKQDALNKWKAIGFDWAFKGLSAIVFFMVKDIYVDVKKIMQTIPVHEVRISNLESDVLINRFKAIRVPMKNEELITYDTLTQN